jgi:hypothetical protein
MKLIAGSILILLMMVQTFTSWLIVVEYIINKEYIANNLCVNKEKPKLHCQGKCQLMKKMAEEEKQTSSNSQTGGKIKMSDVLFTHNLPVPALNELLKQVPEFYSNYLAKTSTGSFTSIFHPPAIA